MDREVVIVGVGEAEAGKKSGKTVTELAAEAAFMALADAGVGVDEVDAIFLENPMSEHHHMPGNVFLGCVGVRPKGAMAFAAVGSTPGPFPCGRLMGCQ